MSGDKVLDMVASHFDELSKTLSNMAQALRRVRSGVRSLRFFLNRRKNDSTSFSSFLYLFVSESFFLSDLILHISVFNFVVMSYLSFWVLFLEKTIEKDRKTFEIAIVLFLFLLILICIWIILLIWLILDISVCVNVVITSLSSWVLFSRKKRSKTIDIASFRSLRHP